MRFCHIPVSPGIKLCPEQFLPFFFPLDRRTHLIVSHSLSFRCLHSNRPWNMSSTDYGGRDEEMRGAMQRAREREGERRKGGELTHPL